MESLDTIAPGARVVIRDAEWLVRKVDRTSTGSRALTVVGITELVKDKEAIFLDEIDKNIEVLDPVDTRLVPDTSSFYQKSLLYMESLLRQTPPTDENLYIGYRAAMDQIPYQLDPAVQALQQPRQRILIADAVGLGKTLACGILLSELIRRGRGKRILVLAVKSMMTQFQKEMWSRFTIPLVRLDSIGIQRVRSHIPTNHNPFYYYDKSIISIDTLKQDAEYRTYIENAFWDIIVIDEAHNVAERGKGSSLRAKLAKLLSSRSDTLIMLSATPHDGKAKSFAGLMNMLDPTAIADPEQYGPEDIKGLCIRRFKKDIRNQVEKAFKQRQISKAYCRASETEETAYDIFSQMTFKKLDQQQGANQLFKTTLEKALFSSPSACLSTIRNRVARLAKNADQETLHDIACLEDLKAALELIGPEDFSKYRKMLDVIRDKQNGFGWSGKDKNDRLVIFTERIETLKFLHVNLIKDFKLNENQAVMLHGSLPDQEEIKLSRKDETAWPRIHYLWPLNPVLEWINDKVVSGFGRQEAPILSLSGALDPAETVFILSGLLPNRKGHPLVHRWFSICFRDRQFMRVEPFETLIARTGLSATRFPNRENHTDPEKIKSLLPEAVAQARLYMGKERNSFEDHINGQLNKQLMSLDRLKKKQYEQLDLFYQEKKQDEKERKKRSIDRLFDEFTEWVEDTMTTENNPFIQVIAVLRGVTA